MNKIRENILLLLLGGIAFGCSYTPSNQWKVLKTVSREWKKINQKELREGINYLYRLKFIDKKENEDGITALVLTKKGKWKSLNCQLNNIKNKKERWDGKWRMVAFDIPQKYKKGRDALREKLKKIGFCGLQKSVFLSPDIIADEIKELINELDLRSHVTVISGKIDYTF